MVNSSFRDDEILAAWVAKAERRADAHERGEMETIDFDEAIAQARIANRRTARKRSMAHCTGETFMPLTYQQVTNEAMKLTPEERVDLAEKLWVSVDSPEAITQAWDVEIERRMAQLDAGEVETIPVEDVLARLRTKLQ